ncbi:MAG TPA: hypothetical protein DCP11_11145 [Microbacteriaceae bacterium]|jgi:ribosomal protein S27E|nr:hypothetical protein [Microbacteriaceae bacterium]
MPGRLDGNALAGPLSELFTFDSTMASARCLGCGDVAVLARAMVYEDDMGIVVRCSQCEDVLMVVVTEPNCTSIDLRGMAWLQVSR